MDLLPPFTPHKTSSGTAIFLKIQWVRGRKITWQSMTSASEAFECWYKLLALPGYAALDQKITKIHCLSLFPTSSQDWSGFIWCPWRAALMSLMKRAGAFVHRKFPSSRGLRQKRHDKSTPKNFTGSREDLFAPPQSCLYTHAFCCSSHLVEWGTPGCQEGSQASVILQTV